MINNLKKVISSAAAVAIVASSASAFAVTFPDVDESASYANAVATTSALGVIEGDDNGLFNPDNNVTRAEFTTMVVRALGEDAAAKATTTSQFTDAANTTVHWAAGYVAQGVADGWINGYGDGTFGPDDSVTYAQAVKMLVSAIGYELYAQRAGGWPSGYLSYGSSLNIVNGVSAESNDTELTRAQCAVLVNNAMRAPVVVTGDITTGNGIFSNAVQESYVTMNGQGSNWQTLLTKFHDAYVVRGRVMGTSKTTQGRLEANEVNFQVESADNFDGEYYSRSEDNAETFQMYVGDTNAADMLFTYAEAVVQQDKDSDEWTILSITPYGSSKTETFAASDVADDDSDYPADELWTNGRIPVYRSAGSSSTIKYELDENASLYVNGVEIDMSDENLYSYIIENATGNVTLIDETETGSTSTDGDYDYVLVDYYKDAVVEYVQTTNSDVRLFFKNYEQPLSSRLTWDPEDDNVTVSFATSDGTEVAYEDLAEYDVLSIAYDVSSSFANSSFYDVLVSKNTVSGTVTSKDTAEGTIRIDGQDYELADAESVNNYELSTEYTLYLDAFGYVAHYEEGTANRNYGVVVGMYTTAGGDEATIRIITADGSVIEEEARNDEEANKFYTLLNRTGVVNPEDMATSDLDVYDGSNFTKGTQPEKVLGDIQNNVVTYRLSSSGLRYDDTLVAYGGEDLEYRASAQRLGSYRLSDTTTRILDMDGYVNGSDTSAGTLSVSSFEDEATYTAYSYDRNNDGDYRFVMVLSGTTSLRPDSAVAVVKTNPQQTTVNDNDCLSMTVARNGVDTKTLLYEMGGEDLSEGDIIAYTAPGSDGYVEAGNLVVLYKANSNYNSLYDDVLNSGLTNFNKMLESGNGLYDPETGDVLYGSSSKEVKQYFGPIYQKSGSNLELIIGQSADGTTDTLDQTQTINDISLTSDTNCYIYDYSQQTKYRVSAAEALPNYSSSLYKSAYIDDNNSVIDWSELDDSIGISFAYVKVVDNDVTDVVVFQSR